MYQSSPLRSTLNTNVITGLGMCTASKNASKSQNTARKKSTKPRKGCVSGSANVPVCGYIYIYTYMFFISQSLQNYAAFGEKNEKDCSPESSNVLKASSPPPTNSGIKKNGIMHQQKCEKWSNTLPPINMK